MPGSSWKKGTWKSLNWITVLDVKKSARQFPGLQVKFSPELLVSIPERMITDPEFAKRRSRIIQIVFSAIYKLKLHTLFRYIPVMFHPLMDCKLTKFQPAETS